MIFYNHFHIEMFKDIIFPKPPYSLGIFFSMAEIYITILVCYKMVCSKTMVHKIH